jgi:hypothetical protein
MTNRRYEPDAQKSADTNIARHEMKKPTLDILFGRNAPSARPLAFSFFA